MVYELLSADWVLEEVLQPMADPQSIEVTVLDTATDEKNDDLETIQSLREQIQETKNELRNPEEGRPGSININYKLITDKIQLNNKLDLLEEETVEHIAAGNGMDAKDWWLRDEHINENLNFATGVIRKRGLGKALYYKAYAEDDEISAAIDLPVKGEVAILAGLGGGTGSGILFDIVERLHREQPMSEITLFGVLPSPREGLDEATNAFTVLSELEYLSLQEGELFEDRVIIPIDPTGFSGKIGDQMGSRDVLKELDESVVYLLIAYYNQQGMEDPFDASPSYAPFTIGIPQILRYRVKDIQDSKERLRELLDVKQEELDAEQKIYEDIQQRFLDRYYDLDEFDNGTLRDDARADLEARLQSIEDMTEFELFQDLEYHSTEIFRNIIQDAKQEEDEIEDQVDIAARQVNRQELAPDQEFRDDIDERLAEILEQDIILLNRRSKLLQSRKTIEISRVRRTVDYLLGLNQESVNTGVWDSNLDNERTEARERLEEKENELIETKNELEEIRANQSEEVNRQLQDWRQAAEEDIHQYNQLQNLNINQLVDNLRSALNQYATSIEQAESDDDVENIPAEDVNSALEELSGELDRVGIDFTHTHEDIRDSLSDLKPLRVDSFVATQDGGLLEEIAPWETGAEKERKEARKNFQLQKREIEDRGIFEIGPAANFSADVSFSARDITEEVEARQRELRSQIVTSLQSRLDSPDRQIIDRFESELERNADTERLTEIAEEAFRSQMGGTEELEQRRDELEQEIAELERQVEILDATYDMFGRRVADRETHESKHDEFEELMRSYLEETSQTTVSTEEDSFAYIKEVTPNNVLRMTNVDHIGESNLFESAAERQELQESLEELLDNAREQQYTGLRERTITDGESRYEHMRVGMAVMSRAISNIDSSLLNARSRFSESFDLQTGSRADRYVSWPERNFGGDWDIGFSVFIDGVFLDNLRNVTDPDGFHESYLRKAQSDDDILIHHSYGLEGGEFIRRKQLLNMERDEDVSFFLQSQEQDIVQQLLDDYIEVIDSDEGLTDLEEAPESE